MVSYFSCTSLQPWPRPTSQHSWGSEVAALLAACSSALFTIAKTMTRAKFLDDTGQLGFQGVQVGAAVKKHIQALHLQLSLIYFYVSIIDFTRNFFISMTFMVKNVRRSYFVLQSIRNQYNQV